MPKMTILINGCTLKEGVENEGWYMEYYVKDGYKLINKQPYGSVGAINFGKWSHKKCLEYALQCQTVAEYEKRFVGAYNACLRHKWVDILDEAFPNRRRKYTTREIIKLMEQYELKSVFNREHPSLAKRARKEGLIEQSEWKDGRKEAAMRRKKSKTKRKRTS